ncbi:MAG TPA: hypothetical protein VFG20_21680 [Planctomycetaceae bacterium]|nr:hypothetical protein [Planctomycetaceae bacterium]
MFDFDEDPVPDAWNRWGVGVALPVLLTGTAVAVMRRTSIEIPFRRRELKLQGWDLTAFGIGLIAVAVFCFAHYHATGTERFHFARQITRLAALIVGLLAIGVIIVHQAVPF